MKQTVVITGASRGIGRAVALAFAEKSASKNNHEEYNIFVNCAKNSELLENVKKQICKKEIWVYAAKASLAT